jgi:hypothetical protein
MPQHELKNYVSITVEDSGRLKNWLMKRRNVIGQQGLLYDYSLSIDDDHSTRVLTTARIVHVDPHTVAMPLDFREQQNDSADLMIFSTVASAAKWSRRARRTERPSNTTDELYSNEIDAVFDILENVEVPRKMRNSDGEILVTNELVRLHLSRTDAERYLIACSCDMRAASVRIIDSSVWRGRVFPIDLRGCRIELRSGQLFHQGHDKENNPIFYFRNMLHGPWRGDVDASIFAILYRLETFFQRMTIVRPSVKVTAVILMGAASCVVKNESNKQPESTDGKVNNHVLIDSDPMMNPNEEVIEHSSVEMITRIIGVLRRHYPERLSKALIVPSTSGKWSKPKMREYISMQQIATPRVIILNKLNELKQYVSDDQLVTFAGGKANVTPDAYSIN